MEGKERKDLRRRGGRGACAVEERGEEGRREEGRLCRGKMVLHRKEEKEEKEISIAT